MYLRPSAVLMSRNVPQNAAPDARGPQHAVRARVMRNGRRSTDVDERRLLSAQRGGRGNGSTELGYSLSFSTSALIRRAVCRKCTCIGEPRWPR